MSSLSSHRIPLMCMYNNVYIILIPSSSSSSSPNVYAFFPYYSNGNRPQERTDWEKKHISEKRNNGLVHCTQRNVESDLSFFCYYFFYLIDKTRQADFVCVCKVEEEEWNRGREILFPNQPVTSIILHSK